jgi:hypothetical protein
MGLFSWLESPKKSRKRKARMNHVIGVLPANASYYSIIIPYQHEHRTNQWMPHEATGPFATLSRGAFSSKSEAHKWAREHLPKSAKYRLRKHMS